MTTYQRLGELRKNSGISQEALAEQMNVTRQTVSRWESGASIPSAENLARLSQLFQVPMESLIWDDWVPPEKTQTPAEEPLPIEVQLPVTILPPVEVPVSRPKHRLALLAAVVLAVGILVGALFFRTPPEKSVPIAETESKVISSSDTIEFQPMLPLE